MSTDDVVRVSKFRFNDVNILCREVSKVVRGEQTSEYVSIGMTLVRLYNDVEDDVKKIGKKVTTKILVDVTEDPNSGFDRLLDAKDLNYVTRLNVMYALLGLAFRELKFQRPLTAVEKLVNVETAYVASQQVDYISAMCRQFTQTYRAVNISVAFVEEHLKEFFTTTEIHLRDLNSDVFIKFETPKDPVTNDWKWFPKKKESRQYAARQYLLQK